MYIANLLIKYAMRVFSVYPTGGKISGTQATVPSNTGASPTTQGSLNILPSTVSRLVIYRSCMCSDIDGMHQSLATTYISVYNI